MNDKIFFFFYDLAHKSVLFDKAAIFTAEILPYIVLLLAAVFLLFHHDVIPSKNPFRDLAEKRKEIFLFFVSVFSAWFLAYLLKYLARTPRPFEVFHQVMPLISESGYAFPSGHATFFMALAVPIFLYHRKIGGVFIALAIFIGLARIVVGVHSPEDILGGFILGAGIAYILSQILLKPVSKKH